MRGLPSGVNSRRCASSGSPRVQVAKRGEASRLLIASASSMRSFAGKNVSRSSAPSLSMGGFCTLATSEARSTARPARQALSSRFDSRMCSRLCSGSASRPSSVSSPDTTEPMRSASAPLSAISSSGGGGQRLQDRQRQAAVRAGCVDGHVDGRAEARDALGSLIPFGESLACHCSATCAAYWSTGRFLRAASPGSTQPAKSGGCSCGNVSIRLPRSPLGSMQIAGMPSMAASSSSVRHRPVLPLPVMPTQTACVVRSRESYSSGSVREFVVLAGRRPGPGRRRPAFRSLCSCLLREISATPPAIAKGT